MTDQLSRDELSKITGVSKSEIHFSLSDAPIWIKVDGYKGSFHAGTVSHIQRQAGLLVGLVDVNFANQQFHGVVFYDEAESIWRLLRLEPLQTSGTKALHPESASRGYRRVASSALRALTGIAKLRFGPSKLPDDIMPTTLPLLFNTAPPLLPKETGAVTCKTLSVTNKLFNSKPLTISSEKVPLYFLGFPAA